jgi:hypothetical protein
MLSAYGQLPPSFETNEGQTSAQVQFFTHGNGGTLSPRQDPCCRLQCRADALPEPR